jgi:hypothetical protein
MRFTVTPLRYHAAANAYVYSGEPFTLYGPNLEKVLESLGSLDPTATALSRTDISGALETAEGKRFEIRLDGALPLSPNTLTERLCEPK